MDFQCWFCGHGIEREDKSAMMITLENIWKWEASSTSADDPMQMVYGHSSCVKDRLRGATMELDPKLFGEDGDQH